jgi:hypothetical protein
MIQERAAAQKKEIARTELLPPYSLDSDAVNPFLLDKLLKTMEARVDELDSDLRILSLQIHGIRLHFLIT